MSMMPPVAASGATSTAFVLAAPVAVPAGLFLASVFWAGGDCHRAGGVRRTPVAPPGQSRPREKQGTWPSPAHRPLRQDHSPAGPSGRSGMRGVRSWPSLSGDGPPPGHHRIMPFHHHPRHHHSTPRTHQQPACQRHATPIGKRTYSRLSALVMSFRPGKVQHQEGTDAAGRCARFGGFG
jgi:hypothetical protein